MASTIQLKTGTGSAVPSSLTQGEVAINVDNGLFYYGSGSINSVKQLETFTNITASIISASGHIFADRIAIGDGDSSFAGQLTVEGDIVANRNITGDDQTAIIGIKQIISNDFVSSSQLISEGNITASLNISASGDILAARFIGNGTNLTGINHDTLDNFVANEHINHTSVTLTAGNGLSGGGDISDNRSFAVDAAQTTITSVTNTSLKVGRATDDTYIDFGTDDKIQLKPANATALEVETTGIDVTGEITASGNISASGNLVGTQLDVNGFAGAVKVTGGDTGNLFAISNIDTLNLGKLAHLTTTNLVGSLHMSQPDAGHITASGNISASGTIYGRQIEQHDMSAGGFVISSTTKTYFPFGGQSHLENTNNLNQNIQKLAVAPGKPLKVNIKSVSNNTGLGNTGFTCSYWRVPDGDSASSNLIFVGEKRANSTGTNFEVVTFDFKAGVDSGSHDDVQDGDLVFMAILGDTTLSNMNVLSATALWEWDYNDA